MKAEEEIVGLNCDIADFLSGMVPTELVTICVHAGATMKRNEVVLAGQYWRQGDREMTAFNQVIPGMSNTRESATLSAAAEAVAWKHTTEFGEKGQVNGQLSILPNYRCWKKR